MAALTTTDYKIILQIMSNMMRMFGLVMIIPGLMAFFFYERQFAVAFLVPGFIVAGLFCGALTWRRRTLR